MVNVVDSEYQSYFFTHATKAYTNDCVYQA